MKVFSPCGICNLHVRGNAKAVCCDICDKWVHISCNNISNTKYAELNEPDNNESFVCLSCMNSALPFGKENDKTFTQTNTLGFNGDSHIDDLTFKLNTFEKKSISYLSNLILQNNDPNSQNSNFCKYYNLDEFTKKDFDQTKHFSIFHLNIHSLQFHKNDLDILLDTLKYEFDIISISETKLHKGVAPTTDIEIPNYNIEHTPTEASKGGTLLYISDKHISKPRKDLEIYVPKKIESTFVEILVPKGKNIIVGCLYKHHNIAQKDFNQALLPILTKIQNENKVCYLSGDFNMNLLDLDKEKEVETYFDNMTDHKFMPLITCPTRINKSSKTLIDNIFYNQFSSEIVSGNLTVGISDHLPQFALIPNAPQKANIMKNETKQIRNYKQIDSAKLNADLDRINWTYEANDDVNQYGSNFLNVFNQLLDIHAPLKTVKPTKSKTKQKSKPWINDNIIKLIKAKDKVHARCIKEKDAPTKQAIMNDYKKKITKQIRIAKKAYYNDYFEKNSKNVKKTLVWDQQNT